jgi:aminopeptidase N
MQAKAAEHLHPDWQPWLNANGAKQAAMTADAHRTARPMQRPVSNETEAMAVFDVITYSKGQALIRMIESYLGEDAFREGIRRYMHDHAYSNATTADLWRGLEAASGKPVTEVAGPFTEQAGVPLIVAESECKDGQQRVALRLDRFSIRYPDAKPQSWQVPIAVGALDATRPLFVLLQRADDIAFNAGACGALVKLNLGDIGYYRVQYDEGTQAKLAAAIKRMAPADRVNFLTDTWALAEASRSNAATYLDLVDQLGSEDNRAVAEQVIRTLIRVDFLERGRPGRAAFQAYARTVLRPIFDRLGWQGVAGEANDRVLMRARLIGVLGDFGDETILAEAKQRFAAYLSDPASLPPNLRGPVTHLVGRTADRAMYNTLLALARKSTNTGERMRYYSALASDRDPALARETLAIALTDELPNSMIGTLITWVASQGEHPELALDFVKEHFEAIVSKQSPSFRHTFMSTMMGNFSDPGRAEELRNFAPAQETSGGRMVAARAIERILAAAEFIDQHMPSIDAWIRRRTALQ